MCVRGSGGAEEPGEPSAEQEPRAGAAEQRPKQRPRPADTPGSTHKVNKVQLHVHKSVPFMKHISTFFSVSPKVEHYKLCKRRIYG